MMPENPRPKAAATVNSPTVSSESGAEQHRQHQRADRARNAEIAAEGDQMALRHRHRDAAQHRGGAHHRKYHIGRPAEHAGFFAGAV